MVAIFFIIIINIDFLNIQIHHTQITKFIKYGLLRLLWDYNKWEEYFPHTNTCNFELVKAFEIVSFFFFF